MYALEHAALATPIGFVLIQGDDDTIHRITLASQGAARPSSGAAVREAHAQLGAYFEGRLRRFDLPLAPAATHRGAMLREAIAAIDYGATAGYGELAIRVGSSARALGQACARNPFPLVVPCHRVLHTGGVLGPYSAGEGPPTKSWLLDFERQRARP